MNTFDQKFIKEAYNQALKAKEVGEVPVGAVLVDNTNHKIIAKAYNKKEKTHDVTSHAEILVIKKASKARENWRLENTTLYVTLEPCPMCMSAILQSRISRVVFSEHEPNSGACGSKLDLTKFTPSNTTVFCFYDPLFVGPAYHKLITDFYKERRKENQK